MHDGMQLDLIVRLHASVFLSTLSMAGSERLFLSRAIDLQAAAVGYRDSHLGTAALHLVPGVCLPRSMAL